MGSRLISFHLALWLLLSPSFMVASTVAVSSATSCSEDVNEGNILSFSELKAIFAQDTAVFDARITALGSLFNDSLLRLSREQWLDLVEGYPRTVVALLQHTFGGTEIKVPTVIDLKDTWSLFLIQESLKHDGQKKVAEYLRLIRPVSLFGEPLQSVEQTLYETNLIDPHHPAIHWEEIFYGVGRIRGLERVSPVADPQKWATKHNRRGMLLSLYGAFCESWHRGFSPSDTYLPGPSVKVKNRSHADAWRVEWQQPDSSGPRPKMLVKGFTEIKASIIGFHEKGRYQIFSFLRRLMDKRAKIEIYGHTVPREDILVETKKGNLTLEELTAKFWKVELYGDANDPLEDIQLGDARWAKFVPLYQEYFGEDFYEVIIPKDHAPLVATVLRNADTNVAKITPGLLTCDEARDRFAKFVEGHLAPAGVDSASLRQSIFGTETAEIADLLLLGPRVSTASSPNGERRVAFSWSPGFTHPQRLEMAFREAVETNSEYAKLLQAGQTRERDFVQKSLLPNIGMRLLYQAPGKLRPVEISPGRVHFPKSDDARALTIVWSDAVESTTWSYLDDNFTLTIPATLDVTTDPDTDRMLNHGLLGHDLQRYMSTRAIQDARHALGEPRLFVKPGQTYALEQYRLKKMALQVGEQLRMFVLGPTAFGKSYVMIEIMRDRMREAAEGKIPRNIFFAITEQKHIATQIGEEIGKSNLLGMSASVDYQHIAWETDEGRAEYPLEKLIAVAENDPRKPIVVTVNWDFFTSQMGKANGNGQKLLKKLKGRVNGLYIDEADQCKDQKYRQAVHLVAKDNPDVALIGIDAVSLDSAVIDGVFGGNLVSVYGDRMAPALDRASMAFQQMQIAAYLGEITPPVDFRSNHVITHIHPNELLKDIIKSRSGVKDAILFSPIKDDELREEAYSALFGGTRDFFIRNQGFIRVNTTEQADQLAEFLQRRSNELGLGINFAAIHHKIGNFSDTYEKWKNPGHPEHIHWAISVRLFDEAVNAPHMSGALILTDDMDPSVFLEVIGRPMRNYPGKRFAEVYQISHKPIAREELQKALVQKEDWVKAQKLAAQRQVEQHLVASGPRVRRNTSADTVTTERLAAGDVEARAQFTEQNLVPLFPVEAGQLIDFNERRERLKNAVIKFRSAMLVLGEMYQRRGGPREEVRRTDRLLSEAQRELANALFHALGEENTIPMEISHWRWRSPVDETGLTDEQYSEKVAERFVEDGVGLYPQFSSDLPGNFILERLLGYSSAYRKQRRDSFPWTHEMVLERLQKGAAQNFWKLPATPPTPQQVETLFAETVEKLIVETHELDLESQRLRAVLLTDGPNPRAQEFMRASLRPRMEKCLKQWNILLPHDPVLMGLTADLLSKPVELQPGAKFGEHTMTELLHFLRDYPGIAPALAAKDGYGKIIGMLLSTNANDLTLTLKAYVLGLGSFRIFLSNETPSMANSAIQRMMTADPIGPFLKDLTQDLANVGAAGPLDAQLENQFNSNMDQIHCAIVRKFLGRNVASANVLNFVKFAMQEAKQLGDFLETVSDLRQPLDMKSQIRLESEIDKLLIFSGQNANPYGNVAAFQQNTILMVPFPSSISIRRESITNIHDLQNFQVLAMQGKDNCDPAIPSPFENLWRLDFSNLTEDQIQEKIKEQFDMEFRRWYNTPFDILSVSHMAKYETQIRWYNDFAWQAQQFILIQKTLKPENRFMPLEEFSKHMVDSMKFAADRLQGREHTLSTVANRNAFPEPAQLKLDPLYRNLQPDVRWELTTEGLVNLRNYFTSYRTRLNEIREDNRGANATKMAAIWSEVVRIDGLTREYIQHADPKTPKFFERENDRIATLLYQVDRELHKRDSKTYPKPTRPSNRQ